MAMSTSIHANQKDLPAVLCGRVICHTATVLPILKLGRPFQSLHFCGQCLYLGAII